MNAPNPNRKPPLTYERDHLEGTVNGGGKSVALRSSAGSIHPEKR